MRESTKTDLNEKGFASIVIALVLIIVLALLTVGFAQLSRREQQTALDKQKAIQAQYAAESGINNAYRDILSGEIDDANASDTNCLKAGNGPGNISPSSSLTAKGMNVNTTNGVSYSCVLVALHTDNLQIDKLSPGSGRHMLFGTDAPLDSLTLAWGSNTGRTEFASSLDPTNPKLLTNDAWTYPPLLEFSITPAASLPAVNPDKYLRDNTFTLYAYPASGGTSTVNFNPANTGQVVSGACAGTETYACSLKLTGLGGKNKYVIRVTGFYDTANILITATGTNGNATKFTGEPSIDVTGKARDVLKRLRVRVFLSGGSGSTDNNSILPNSAIEAQNVCKRIQAAPPTPSYPSGSSYDGLDSSCNLSN